MPYFHREDTGNTCFIDILLIILRLLPGTDRKFSIFITFMNPKYWFHTDPTVYTFLAKGTSTSSTWIGFVQLCKLRAGVVEAA